MVMHARKPQRINDGYFEKHQTHPYQNSNYNSSKTYSSNSERYEKFRDSPNGNAYRSSNSPDTQSPPSRDRDKSYQSSAKNSYLQKIREKERDNRDFKMARDKYSDCTRSPKDKRNRDSDHRATNERAESEKNTSHSLKSSQLSRDRKPVYNNCTDKVLKKDDRERVVKVGDWSEHVSSSGKKYYYNCKTEVSQWEKPREWIERERDRYSRGGRDRERDDRYRDGSSRSNTRHDKHSNYRSSNSSGNSSKDGSSATARHWNSNSSSSRETSEGMNSHRESSSDWGGSSSRRHSNPDNSVSISNSSAQDMDISPGDSTPTSEVSYGAGSGSAHQTPLTGEQIGPVLLANALPRLTSHPSNTSTSMNNQQSHSSMAMNSTSLLLSPPEGGATVLHSSSAGSNAPGPPGGGGGASAGGGANGSLSSDCKKDSLNIDITQISGSGNCTSIDGPPTPTHSEITECVKAGSPPSSSGLSSGIQSVSSSLQALRPQGPTLTPSLANHYRDDLVNHVKGWPAEVLEKQAQKLSEETHIMGSIHCAKVSAELKSARSIVRLTEIQATLQEQRILFLRQQIKELEELKSQNSFMSDDS